MSDEEVASSTAQEEASPARLPTRPGDLVVEKYEVERILGAGGMGIVVSAVHLDLQERVAIKFMLPEVAVVPAAANRFLREAQATSRLKSERIARLHDVGRLGDGTPFMVMELLEGETLDRVLDRDGAMEVAALVDLVLQACEPLDEAHRVGIVHRDVKPENLFLAERPGEGPLVKVLDFGISKVQASISITVGSGMMGTATYTSPEQLRNPSDVGPAADVWSLGIILFEGLTGTVPYGGASFAEICASVLHEDPPRARTRRPDLPAALEEVVDRCITKDEARRITSMAELAGALAPFATEEGRALAARIVRRSARVPEECASTPPPPPEAAPVVAAAPSPAAEAEAPAAEVRPSFAESLTPLTMGGAPREAAPPPAVRRRSRRGLLAGTAAVLVAAAAIAALVRGPSTLLAADHGGAAAPAGPVAPAVRAIVGRIADPASAEVPRVEDGSGEAAPGEGGGSVGDEADVASPPEPPALAPRPAGARAVPAAPARAPTGRAATPPPRPARDDDTRRARGQPPSTAAPEEGPAVDGAAGAPTPDPTTATAASTGAVPPAGSAAAPEDGPRAYPFGVVPVYP